MNIHQCMKNVLLRELRQDFGETLLGAFDESRRADTYHHGRTGVYGAAFGVFGELADSPCRGDERVLDVAQRMLDRICDWQREDGQWDWYLPATGKTHRLNYVWSVYSWLRLIEDYGEHLTPERRERVEHMLRRSMEVRLAGARQFLGDGTHPASNNIFFNCTLELWYAGRLFGEAEWSAIAAEAMDRDIATQFPDGYWPDANRHRGPTTMYNTVSLKAVAAYALKGGDRRALEAVQRAAAYHLAASYPDGSCVETFDERNRYSAAPATGLTWMLSPFASTRGVAAFFGRGLMDRPPDAKPAAISAMQVDSWRATPDEEVVPAEHPTQAKVLLTIPALTVRRGPWFACLSGATTRLPSTHFHHDLQNHVSVWHDRLGVTVGGGNSLHDPRLSTFFFHGVYLADEGSVEAIAGGGRLRLRYGLIRAVADLTFPDDLTARFDARAEGDLPEDAEFACCLYRLHGKPVTLADGVERTLGEYVFWAGFPDENRSFRAGKVTVSADRPLRAMWPCRPVNIYDPPALLPIEQAVLRVSVSLKDGPARLTLRVEP